MFAHVSRHCAVKSCGTLPSGRSGTCPLMNSKREPAATSQAPAYEMEVGLIGLIRVAAMVVNKASRRFMLASVASAASRRLGENCSAATNSR